jgi:hypothetical protein
LIEILLPLRHDDGNGRGVREWAFFGELEKKKQEWEDAQKMKREETERGSLEERTGAAVPPSLDFQGTI